MLSPETSSAIIAVLRTTIIIVEVATCVLLTLVTLHIGDVQDDGTTNWKPHL